MNLSAALAAAEESAPAAPWANAFFLTAVFVAVAYFGWNLYQGKKAKDAQEEQDLDSKGDGADAEEPGVRDGTEDVADPPAGKDDEDGDQPR